jgi:hypothetical protein
MAQASELSFPFAFHTANCAVHSGNPIASDSPVFIHHSQTHKKTHTELTDLMGNLWCAREHSVQFFVQFFCRVDVGVLIGQSGGM